MPKVKQELSEYERQRQANIVERDALLKKLSLEAVGAGLGPGKSNQTVKPSFKSKKKVSGRIKKEEVVPRRQSSRLAGLEADSEIAKRKAETDHEVAREAARQKRIRVSGDLNLSDIVIAGQELGQGVFADVIKRGSVPYQRTFGEDEVKATSDKELRALRERMSGLELYDGWEPNRIKMTPERIYSMSFHPEPSKPIVCAGDKLGNLGIFDASQRPRSSSGAVKPENGIGSDDDAEEVDEDPVVTAFHLHTRTISSMQFSPANPSHLITSSYDSSIRLLDLSTSNSKELYGPKDTEEDEPLSGLEVNPVSPHSIYFSRLDGFVGRHDSRAPSSTATLWQLSDKKIGGFSLHPQYPQFLATASLDRNMRLWDLRMMVKWEGDGKRPVLLGEHTSRLSVSHAAFNSVGQVATSSYDDTIKLYSFEGMSNWKGGEVLEEPTMDPKTTIRHNNQTGRWVTILRPQWQVNPSDSVQRFVIGNMNRFVDVYAGSGEQLAQLGGEGVTAVPAVAQFHPTRDWVCGGTASGKLCLWM